jgi:hypothetical protein
MQAGQYRFYDEQGHQAEKYIRAHDDPAVYAESQEQRSRQGALRDSLTRDRRDVYYGPVVRQHVED